MMVFPGPGPVFIIIGLFTTGTSWQDLKRGRITLRVIKLVVKKLALEKRA
jgi:hypothetical protein